MSEWVKLTTNQGEPIYVNLDKVATIQRRSDPRIKEHTVVTFAEGREDLSVDESPDMILEQGGD
jgi:hypothetical protein